MNKNKKRVFGMLAAMVICMTSCAAFTGCGDNADSTADNNNNSAATTTANTPDAESVIEPAQTAEGDVDIATLGDKLKSDITFEDELVQFDNGKVEKILGISQDLFTNAKVYESSSGATPEAIDCIEAKDENAANEIKTALENRLSSQKTLFESYKPEQMPKLENAVIKVNGKYVVMVVSGDSDKANEIIGWN